MIFRNSWLIEQLPWTPITIHYQSMKEEEECCQCHSISTQYDVKNISQKINSHSLAGDTQKWIKHISVLCYVTCVCFCAVKIVLAGVCCADVMLGMSRNELIDDSAQLNIHMCTWPECSLSPRTLEYCSEDIYYLSWSQNKIFLFSYFQLASDKWFVWSSQLW